MKSEQYRRRRIVVGIVIFIFVALALVSNNAMWQPSGQTTIANKGQLASEGLERLDIKGRAPKTDYQRIEFGDGWRTINGCDTRNIILHRDLKKTTIGDQCKVLSGTLNDPYTGKTIIYNRSLASNDIQIDHVVALSDAWQKGAQQLTKQRRNDLANDPLELLAVDGPTNQLKGDGDAATWLPPNKLFRCQYVARQIAIKLKYELWITSAEHDAIERQLMQCPDQRLPDSRS